MSTLTLFCLIYILCGLSTVLLFIHLNRKYDNHIPSNYSGEDILTYIFVIICLPIAWLFLIFELKLLSFMTKEINFKRKNNE